MSIINLSNNIFKKCFVKNNNPKFNDIEKILKLYKKNDWKNYLISDNIIVNNNFTYYKYKIPITNNLFELYLLKWYPSSVTPIHNHPYNNGCVMKILHGKLIENVYKNNNYQLFTNTYKKNDIFFIDNKLLHRVYNNTRYISYSLHLYY
mgnify:CR=1 FL=1